ncbi:MFS transporter [Demequina gelatinilytica]|uniref:MFS transporter n=1 Tax=Demequina gelatinilytica TaxID=1638980 RepID=UPI000785F2B3|nr:MFS transporter [Demequina gelatinilytica]
MTSELRHLRRRFVALTALRWLPTGITAPLLVLLLSARGLSLGTIGLLTALYSATTFLLELPTGGLADVLGRRGVIIGSSVVAAAASIIIAFATSPAWFAAGFMLHGLARALDSGPLQAWYVDSVHAIDPAADLKPGLSRSAVAESASLALGAIAAGAVVTIAPLPPSGGPLIALSVPFLLKAGLSAVQIAATLAWVQDAPTHAGTTARAPGRATRVLARSRDAARDVPATVARGVRIAGASRAVRRLLVFTGALGVALAGIELLAPAHASALLGGETDAAGAYSVLVTAGFLGSAAGGALAPLAARLARSDARAAAFAAIGGACALAAVAAPLAGVAAGAFVAFYLLLGVTGPLTESMLHAEVGARERATMLSVQSMALQSAALVCTAALGAITGATSLAVGFGLTGAALAAGGAALGRLRPGAAAEAVQEPNHAAPR